MPSLTATTSLGAMARHIAGIGFRGGSTHKEWVHGTASDAVAISANMVGR